MSIYMHGGRALLGVFRDPKFGLPVEAANVIGRPVGRARRRGLPRPAAARVPQVGAIIVYGISE
eukprot:8091408-Lingulodinium_polyedra.AAC.1